MIRATAMMIGGLLLLLIACPLHALAKVSPAHHKTASTEPGDPARPA